MLGLLGCLAILGVLQHLSADIDYHAIIHAFRRLPPWALLGAIAATGLSYAALVGRDLALFPLVGFSVSGLPLLLGAGCGSALGNAIGSGALTGGAVRYRVYGAFGASPEQVAKLMLLITVSFACGMLVLTAGSALIAASAIAGLLQVGVRVVYFASGSLLASTALLLIAAKPSWRPLRVGKWQIGVPSRRMIVELLVLVAVDLLGAGLALWLLLPAGRAGLPEFMAIFTAATALGVISHVPSGLGVFDAVVLLALHGSVPPDQVAAALLAYRAIYFLLPLLLSSVLLSVFELRQAQGWLTPQQGERLRRASAQLAPVFLGVITFATGAILVVSGATPAFGHRLALLRLTAPLWLVEASHFLGSLVGVLLLFVARGLFLRLDGAWWLAMALSCVSLALSLMKGLAFGEAAVLLCLIGMLWVARARFDRPASLLRQPFTPVWFMAIGVIAAVALWVMFFAFRDVAYTHDLWWQFAFDAKAPRALRATFAATLLAGAIALLQLLRLAPGDSHAPTPAELTDAARIVRAQDRASAMLALMGDKCLLFSELGDAFLMYARRGRSWIALYDPVGPRDHWPDLIWHFIALANSHGGRVAFYQVRPDSLPLYLEAGLKIVKVGEEAIVPLDTFSLEGSRRSHLRYALKRGEREGLNFELLAPAEAAAYRPAIHAISAAWLRTHRAREKGFSVARLVPGYLAAQSVALVRQHGTPVAFATIMLTDLNGEATVGVMRHMREASPYAMEFLFTQLALHFKRSGFQVLNLGMAPLAGLTASPLSSYWHHVANVAWEHGGRLYNLQGLRSFKNKFSPRWEPRYLAASGIMGPFVTLADVAMLTGTTRA